MARVTTDPRKILENAKLHALAMIEGAETFGATFESPEKRAEAIETAISNKVARDSKIVLRNKLVKYTEQNEKLLLGALDAVAGTLTRTVKPNPQTSAQEKAGVQRTEIALATRHGIVTVSLEVTTDYDEDDNGEAESK